MLSEVLATHILSLSYCNSISSGKLGSIQSASTSLIVFFGHKEPKETQ